MLEYTGKFNKPDILVKEGKYWSIVFRENVVTLGSCVLVCNRKCLSMGDLTLEELEEFPIMCKWYEERIKKLYDAKKFNYIAAMLKDDFVHFHLIPRYDREITRFGFVFKDELWPNKINMNRVEVSVDIKNKIIEELKG